MKKALVALLLILSPLLGAGASQVDYKIYYYDLSNIQLDGTIAVDEYATSKVIKAGTVDLRIGWAHNVTHLAVAISGEFAGWVGFGMNSVGGGMTGSDMIISSVSSGKLSIADYHGIGNTEPVLDDDQMDITAAGKEEGGTTTVEFIIPMKSNDTAGQDHNWEVEKDYSVFFAFHKTSDTLTYHSGRTNPLTVEVEGSSVALPQDRYDTETTGTQVDRLTPMLWVLGGFAVAVVAVQLFLRKK